MCIMYLIYNMLSIPVHTFHVFTAVSSIADEVTGKTTQVTDPLYYVIAVAIIVVIAVITFGGIKSVTKIFRCGCTGYGRVICSHRTGTDRSEYRKKCRDSLRLYL